MKVGKEQNGRPADSAQAGIPRFAILGAGRLGCTLARRWYHIDGHLPAVWSRRFETRSIIEAAQSNIYRPVSLAEIFDNEVVIAAIPTGAIEDLAVRFPAVKAYTGTLLLTGTDLPLSRTREFVPNATLLRLAPFLIAGREDIPALLLCPGDAAQQQGTLEALLLRFGPLDTVNDENAYEVITCLGSPVPVVILSALKTMVEEASRDQGVSPSYQQLAERVLLRALSSMAAMSLSGAVKTGEKEVATPGGITELGLRQAGQISSAITSILNAMLAHARRKRVNQA